MSEEKKPTAEEDAASQKAEKKKLSTLREQQAILKSQLDITTDIAGQVVLQNETRELELKIMSKKIDLKKESLLIDLEAGPAGKAELQARIKEIEQLEKIHKLRVQSQNANLAIVKSTRNIAQTLTGIDSSWRDGLVGGFVMAKISGESFGNSLGHVKSQLKETFNLMDVGVGIISKFVETAVFLALSQDEARSSFEKATGMVGKYGDVLNEATHDNLSFGLSAQDSAASAQSLVEGFSSFTRIGKEAQGDIIGTTAKLQKLGVSATTTAGNLEIATKSLGMTTSESEVFQKTLFGLSQALGKPASEVAEDFSKSAPRLAAHGRNMVGVFKGLEAASKATGISIDGLLGITGKFDTFEGAADAAGTLNAILGGDLFNSVNLMAASEDERIRMLMEGVEASGKSWSSMEKFERMAVASAVGITDINEANKLFGGGLGVYNQAQADLAKTAAEQKEFNDKVATASSLIDQLKSTAMKLFGTFAKYIEPRLRDLNDLFAWFNTLLGESENVSLAINAVLISLGAVLLAIGIKTATATAATILNTTATIVNTGAHAINTSGRWLGNIAIDAMSKKTRIQTFAQNQNTKAQKRSTKATKGAGDVAAKSALGMMAFGVAVAFIGAGIGLAAWGMSTFVKAFSGMDPMQILAVAAAIGVLAAGLYFMVPAILSAGTASTVAAPGLLALGVAVALIGVSIFAAAAGIAMIVDSLGSMFAIMAPNIDGFTMFVVSLTALALVAGILGPALIVGAAGFAALALSLKLIPTDDLKAVGEIFSGISTLTLETAYSVASIAMSIKGMVADINNLETEKTVTFTTLLEQRAKLVSADIPSRTVAANAASTSTRQSSQGEILPVNLVLKLDSENLIDKKIKLAIKRNNNAAGAGTYTAQE